MKIRARSAKRNRIEKLVSNLSMRKLDQDHLFMHELDAAQEEALAD